MTLATRSIRDFGYNHASQNGEDGIIAECLRRMGIIKGICAEFGAANGLFCSNTYKLLKDGWDGYMIEPDTNLYDMLQFNTATFSGIHTYCLPVTPENINVLLPEELDVLSIDTDGSNDYYCFKAYKGISKIVIIEINSSYDPYIDRIEEGVNYSVMKKLGESKGYFVLCHVGNMIFIDNKFKKLFPDRDETFDRKWI